MFRDGNKQLFSSGHKCPCIHPFTIQNHLPNQQNNLKRIKKVKYLKTKEKMERRNRALFCDKCSLQFDKKIVYDMHLSIIHKTKVKNSSEFWEGNQSLMLKSDNTKSNMNNLSLNLIHKETKSHEHSISDNTTSKKSL